MNDVFVYVVEWLPMLLLLGVLLFIMMRAGRIGPKDYIGLVSAQLEETRRQNEILERIAVALEKSTIARS